MASKLHNNAIITGYVDSFCLACGCFLRSEKDAHTHIDKPLHRKNLDLIPYLERFQGDRIRKVPMGYYCEFCNALFPIASKVTLHITKDSHNHNKGSLQLKLYGNDVIAFNNVLIKARSWHGVIDDTCTVCNIEFDDESLHKSDNKHLLNLVQKPVQFGPNNAIFRRVDENALQCLTCEIIIASNTMTEHFNDPKHLSIYDKCRNVNSDDVNEIDTAIPNIENTKNEPKVPAEKLKEKPIQEESLVIDSKSMILESITKYQKNMININLETETASCKKCLVNIKFDYNAIEDHIADHSSLNRTVNSELLYPSNSDKNHNKVDIYERVDEEASKKAILDKLLGNNQNDDTTNTKSISNEYSTKLNHDATDTESETNVEIPKPPINEDDKEPTNSNQSASKETDEYAANFAETNKITYNKNRVKAYCRVCEQRVPSSLKYMKEHVAGARHKKRAGIQSKPKPILKQSMAKFIESKYDNESTLFADAAIVNEKYYISELSFYMITKTDSVLRCQACEVTLCRYDRDGKHHIQSDIHKKAMEVTPVVTSISSEFIREVRAGVFHCGYCNLVAGSWADLEMHLQSSEHDQEKNFAMWRLHSLRDDIAECKRRDAFKVMMMMRMMANPFF